jgi:hypothetical protein
MQNNDKNISAKTLSESNSSQKMNNSGMINPLQNEGPLPVVQKIGITPPYPNEPKKTAQEWKAAFYEAKKEIQELRDLISALQPRQSYSPVNSEAEEELVTKETAWLLPKNKKRKALSSPEKVEDSPEPKSKTHTKVIKVHKPPPVVLSNVNNFNELNQTLKTKNFNYKTNLLNNNQLKINVDNENEYRDLTKFMNETNLEWHTYENKQTRPIRLMAKNLHPTCDPEEIKADLLNKGFKILEVVNKIKKNKNNGKEYIIPLPLFMLTFENTEDIKKLYEIRYICHMRVKIEAIRNNKMIPQCKRCQKYGHTQKFCKHTPTCVKCAGQHITVVCTKPRNDPPKCTNCAEAHPANYRGCIIAKELQKRRNDLNKPKKMQNFQRRTFSSKKATGEVSYAEAARSSNPQPAPVQKEQPSLMQMMQDMMNMMNRLSTRLDSLEARSTGAIPRRPN